MNKNAKTSAFVWIALIVVAALIFGFVKLPQGTSTGDKPLPDGSCELTPTLSVSIVDAVNPGTFIDDAANSTRINGVFRGSSVPATLTYGDNGESLVELPNYIDQKFTWGPIGCGANTLNAKVYATDDSTIKVFNDVGQVVTDLITGGATNQSSSATVIDQEIKFIANSDQSSGDLVCVIEATNTTEVSTMVISGATKVNVPKFYTVAGAGSVAEAYEIPQLIDGASRTYNLKITPESGKTIGATDTGIYFTCYSKQWFVDTDGSFQYGIENADGTTKYEDDFDYDWMIT